jgi:hypothetical protein
MDCEKSIVIQRYADRLNQLLHERGITDPKEAQRVLEDIADEAMLSLRDDPGIVPPDIRSSITRGLESWKGARTAAYQTLRLDIQSTFADQLKLADHCIAFAELITQRFENLILQNIDLLKVKDPRPHPVAVTGALLKCLLILSFQSKICMIADEIIQLIRVGFLSAADSRLRTMHEHVVILVLILNDDTYELSERYQDHAVFEELARLKTYRSNWQESMYRTTPETHKSIALEIVAAEKDASDALKRWGPSITEQYGWARPGLPPAVQKKRRIFFTDLERASGADFLRGDYLTGNYFVHAGPFAAVNHLNTNETYKHLLRAIDDRDDMRIAKIGWAAINYLSDATGLASKKISFETEEYDEFLIACEMIRAANAALASFIAVMDNDLSESPPSSS